MAYGLFCDRCGVDAADGERFRTHQRTVEHLLWVYRHGGWLLTTNQGLLCPECAAKPPDLS